MTKKFDHDKYQHILSVKYRDRVLKACQSFKQDTSLDHFCLTIYLYNGDFAWLVPQIDIAIDFVERGFERADKFFDINTYRGRDVIYYDDEPEDNLIQNLTRETRHNEFKSFVPYCFVGECPDCLLTVAVAYEKPYKNAEEIYQKTATAVRRFSNQFLNETLDIFLEALPALAATRFAHDETYRQQVIEGVYKLPDIKLTDSEAKVLYWAGQGKSVDETSLIIELSPSTVSTYRQKIIQKLGATNIAHAINLAKQINLIA